MVSEPQSMTAVDQELQGGASGYGVGASGYGVGASRYGVGASGYGSLVILVSAQVLLVLTLDFGLGLDNNKNDFGFLW